MRRAALLLLILVACSKGENKSPPGADPKPGSGPGGGEPGKPGEKEKSVKGTLTLGGVFSGAWTWKRDLDLSCSCINETNWQVGVPLSDDKGTVATVTINPATGIVVTSGKLGPAASDELRSEGGAGISGGCKPDNRNVDGVLAIDLDAKVTGKAGEVTIKGHLDVVCREGL